MIKVERISVTGVANALYGMRLPKLSFKNADTICNTYDKKRGIVCNKSIIDITSDDVVVDMKIGENDRTLAKKLVLAGTDHGKWLRQCFISILITAPMTFFWDFDTYKVATTKNSSSRMHKITSRPLTVEDFSWDDENGNLVLTPFREEKLKHLNGLIEKYNNCHDAELRKDIFRELIQDLDAGYNFTALWTGSGQTARNYYFARKNHRQRELRELAYIFGELPYIGEFVTAGDKNED